MGSSSSKKYEIGRKQHSAKSTPNLVTKTENRIKFEERRNEVEKKYKKLQIEHKKLQESFVQLKEKYDVENGDFIAHTKEITDKLKNAFHEKTVQETNDGGKGDDLETIQLDDADELRGRLMENDLIIESLHDELEKVKICNEKEKTALKEACISKGSLLNQKYEEELKQINMMWEQRISEVRNHCLVELAKNTEAMSKEKFDIEQQLKAAMLELAELEKKNQLLQTGFDEIRARYENRESRFEDLDKIADLEGQIMVQAEELDKQKKLVKSLTNKIDQNGFESGEGTRVKKTPKKRRKNSGSNSSSPRANTNQVSSV